MPIRVLRRGSKGPFVAELQKSLNSLAGYDLNIYSGNGRSLYPPLKEDGIYGKNTVRRVKEYQQWNPPLKVDGLIGPKSYAKITGNLWTPDLDRKAAAAAPPANAPSVLTGPKQDGYLYLMSARDFRSEMASGNHPKRSQHPKHECYHHYIPDDGFRQAAVEMGTIAKDNNLNVRELIINGHSGGAGVINMGGTAFYMGGTAVSFFKYVKPYLASNAIIWIFACSFATPGDQINDDEHDIIWPDEMQQGRGTQAMIDIARYTGCEVRAGFGFQTKNFDGFFSAWAKVTPSGKTTMYHFGRPLSVGEWITGLTDGTSAAISAGSRWLLSKF